VVTVWSQQSYWVVLRQSGLLHQGSQDGWKMVPYGRRLPTRSPLSGLELIWWCAMCSTTRGRSNQVQWLCRRLFHWSTYQRYRLNCQIMLAKVTTGQDLICKCCTRQRVGYGRASMLARVRKVDSLLRNALSNGHAGSKVPWRTGHQVTEHRVALLDLLQPSLQCVCVCVCVCVYPCAFYICVCVCVSV